MQFRKYIYFSGLFSLLMCLTVIFSSYTAIHRYYFSMAEVKIDSKNKTIDVSCKLFTSDLEDALGQINRVASVRGRGIEEVGFHGFQGK